MTRAARALTLLAGALTMALIPSVPALAAFDSCRMPGCGPNQEQALTLPDCCCGVANTPAINTVPATVLLKEKPVTPIAMLATDDGRSSGFIARDVAVQPPAHVPLFLLHSSLLI